MLQKKLTGRSIDRVLNQGIDQGGNRPTQRAINSSTNQCEIHGKTRTYAMNRK